jgi:fructokinase
MAANKVICFGEILWDVFPDKKVIGGAPLNVALRLHSFEVPVAIISCIGTDKNGDMAKSYLDEWGLTSEYIQIHQSLETGIVTIALDDSGSASYEIGKPVAWDAIALSPELISLVKETPFFLFGSLAARGAFNRNTLQSLLNVARFPIFDVNLRPPHFDISMVYELMQRAQFVKLNDEELQTIANRLGCEQQDMKSQINWLSKITNTNNICVTRGPNGAILLIKDQFIEHPGYRVDVNDTVGAGDSFLATLVNELLIKQESPAKALKTACAVGALVASKEGANCVVTSEEINVFIA